MGKYPCSYVHGRFLWVIDYFLVVNVAYESKQKQQQKEVTSSSRESIQGDIGELIPSSPYQG